MIFQKSKKIQLSIICVWPPEIFMQSLTELYLEIHWFSRISHLEYLPQNLRTQFVLSSSALSEGFGLYYWPVLPLMRLESQTLINSKPLHHKFRQVPNRPCD